MSFRTNAQEVPHVTALFRDGSHSFLLSQGATFAELATHVDALGASHEGAPVAVHVEFAPPSSAGSSGIDEQLSVQDGVDQRAEDVPESVDEAAAHLCRADLRREVADAAWLEERLDEGDPKARNANADKLPDPRALMQSLARYREPHNGRSIFELTITVLPFIALWILMWSVLDAGYWIGLLLAVPAAGFLVRLFLIQHDCGHGSFFRHRLANDWVGRGIGVLTLTPYDVWRRAHALHHANSGNLDRRGIGDIDTLTVLEFRARTRFRRLLYRLYRHPIVMFCLGPAYVFLLRHRLPMGLMRDGWKPWASAMATNAAIIAVVSALIWMIGAGPFILVQLPITLLAASSGVWLFYVQHQFEDTFWEHQEGWSFHEAALHGSSHYDLPGILRWFTANIGVHHVHHLSSRIPCYRLPEVLRDHAELRKGRRLTLLQSLKSVPLVLWNEKERRLVSFAEAASDKGAHD